MYILHFICNPDCNDAIKIINTSFCSFDNFQTRYTIYVTNYSIEMRVERCSRLQWICFIYYLSIIAAIPLLVNFVWYHYSNLYHNGYCWYSRREGVQFRIGQVNSNNSVGLKIIKIPCWIYSNLLKNGDNLQFRKEQQIVKHELIGLGHF